MRGGPLRWKVRHKPDAELLGTNRPCDAMSPPIAAGLLVPPASAMLADRESAVALGDPDAPPVAHDERGERPEAVARSRSQTSSSRHPLLARAASAAIAWFQRRLGTAPSGWVASLFVHLILLIVLALIGPAIGEKRAGPSLIAWTDDGDAVDAASLTTAVPLMGSTDVTIAAPQVQQFVASTNPLQVDLPKIDSVPNLAEKTATTASPNANPSPPQPSGASDLGKPGRTFVAGGGLGGRDAGNRPRLIKQDGGTKTSEVAMESGLIWIANHQKANGGWSFDHRTGQCDSRCRNPGTVASTTAATGLALLSFLGAGYTHRHGPFQNEVDKGLYYLTGRMLSTPNGGDLQEGTMYAQGIASLALCEAYAMTGDESLRPFAQKAVDFIVYAQNPKTGGWRYVPGQPGDTTVLGWQLMALRSARMAKLEVPEHVIYRATRFLDSVQDGDGHYRGAFYGYLGPERANFTTSSVGLLCRMYTGWDRSSAALIHGVDAIAKQGPSRDDMYYNYQATQVMHHWGGTQWRKWNARLRDYLVQSQAREGHEFGSWHFDDKHSAQGGRLYNTALAVMMLQVYYRYLPLYTDKATAADQAASQLAPLDGNK